MNNGKNEDVILHSKNRYRGWNVRCGIESNKVMLELCKDPGGGKNDGRSRNPIGNQACFLIIWHKFSKMQ